MIPDHLGRRFVLEDAMRHRAYKEIIQDKDFKSLPTRFTKRAQVGILFLTQRKRKKRDLRGGKPHSSSKGIVGLLHHPSSAASSPILLTRAANMNFSR
jgi:hypothetical protein